MNSYERIYDLLLVEYSDDGKRFDRKTSPLTPQKHNMSGKTGPIEFVKNALDIRRKIKSSPKGSPVHFAKEGGVDSNLEKLTKIYSRIKGRKFSSGSLEHPDYDPNEKGNKAEKITRRKFGRKATVKGRESAFSPDPKKRNDKKSYHQSDWEDNELKSRPKRPSKWEKVQRLGNRLRRRGHDDVVRKHQKMGMTVVGTLGAGHFEDKD